MTEDIAADVSSDSFSLNVLSESLSRAILLISGIVSSALLYRAIDISWSISDYANLKVLTYTNQVLSIIILAGLTSAVIRSVSQNVHKKNRIGSIIIISFGVITFCFLAVAFTTTFLAEPILFLVGETPAETALLRSLWIIVLLSMLPSAYLQIIRCVFTGLQRIKRILLIDVIYNLSRISILVYFFINTLITIENVLYMYLFTTVFGFMLALTIMYRELRKEQIVLRVKGWREISKPLFEIAGVMLAVSLISSFGNFVAPLLVNYFGTPTNMARYSIAQSMFTTIKSFLYAPFAVLLPNLAGMTARNEHDELKKRFEESNRIIIPTLIFATCTTISFGEFMLGMLYGGKGIDSSNGLSAATFLIVLAPGLFTAPLSGIYSNLLFAFGKVKAMLGFGVLQVILQISWIVFLQPHYGVVVIAFLWVIGIPIFFLYHYYSKNSFNLFIKRNYFGKSFFVIGIYFIITIVLSNIGLYVVNLLSFLPLFDTTTIRSFAVLAFAVPLWYIFIVLCLIFGLMDLSDLNNLKKFLKKIPPLWWVTKLFLNRIEEYLRRRNQLES